MKGSDAMPRPLSAFRPYHQSIVTTSNGGLTTTFEVEHRPHLPPPVHSSPPVRLVHASSTVQAIPRQAPVTGPSSSTTTRIVPIRQMSAITGHCPPAPSVSSPARSTMAMPPAASPLLRIAQPPHYGTTAHLNASTSTGPHSSSSLSSGSSSQAQVTCFPPSRPPSQGGSLVVKPQIISGSVRNAASAVNAILHSTRDEMGSKTHYELSDIARLQQQQIDTNRAEIDNKQRLIAAARMHAANGGGGPTTAPLADRIATVRRDIDRDEAELANLSTAQRHIRQMSVENDQKRRELMALQEIYSQDGRQLREAVDKVDSLKKQLDLLYRRRASAASAAIAQQRQINAQHSSTSASPKMVSSVSYLQRPQAFVGPFQVVQAPSSDSSSGIFDQLDHAPVAAGKPNVLRVPQRKGPVVMKRPDKPPPPPKRNPALSLAAATGYENGGSNLRLMNNGVEQRSLATDYAHNLDNAALSGRTEQLSIRNDSMKAVKRRSWIQHGEGSENDIFRMLLEEQKKGRSHVSFSDLNEENPPIASGFAKLSAIPPVPESFSTPVKKSESSPIVTTPQKQVLHPLPKPPPMSQADSDSATSSPVTSVSVSVISPEPKTKPQPTKIDKEPAPPAPKPAYSGSSSSDEGPSPTKERPVLESPKKVEDKVTVAYVSTSESFSDEEERLKAELERLSIANSVEEQQKPEPVKLTEIEEVDSLSPSPSSSDEGADAEEENENEEDEEEIDHEDIPSSSTSETDASAPSDIDTKISVVFDSPPPAALKGILLAPCTKGSIRRVVFDPFVLFLDGALEGQLETVVENSTKISDVSLPNDEGITALHNAICACHYDIVKFLVDAGADVNALDSDGWSPLHCAASCNNLAMLKLLVEHGACIYAATYSDAETPIRKCEEKEAGFEQCIRYLEMCDAWTGVINDSVVYALFNYTAARDTELSFTEGDALRVISREAHVNKDDWWLCESTATGSRGFVPTNFIALYPTLGAAQKMNFKNFEIPMKPPPTVRTSSGADSGPSPTTANGNNNNFENGFEKSVELSANA